MHCASSPSVEGDAVGLTVLLATHNGAATLPQVLRAYEKLIAPAGGWKVIVVDNASTDSTPALLAAATKLPLTALRTEQRGKNVALNIGLQHLEGDLVVLTDDDAIPDQDWLVKLRDVADTATHYDVFAGKIVPAWPPNTPDWIERIVPLGATYAATSLALKPGPISATQVWGANMAVRRPVFSAGHRFNEGVGPQAGQYIMGSEVEFTCRLETFGHRSWFDPRPVVQHIIRPNQVEAAWIFQRAYRLGRHMFYQERPSMGSDLAMLRGAPRWKYRMLLENRLRQAWYRVTGQFDHRFKADWEVSFLRGYLDEAASQTRT